MALRVLVLFAALTASPGAAMANALADSFLDLLAHTCLPAIETAEAPDLSAFMPYDGANPDHNVLGPTVGDGFVLDDPRLLIAYGEQFGLRGCEVSFAEEMPGADGAAIADALDAWIYGHLDSTDYRLIENCPSFGYRMFVSAGTAEPNPRGHFVRILATATTDPDDETQYGNPRVLVAETEEPPAEYCIAGDKAREP